MESRLKALSLLTGLFVLYIYLYILIKWNNDGIRQGFWQIRTGNKHIPWRLIYRCKQPNATSIANGNNMSLPDVLNPESALYGLRCVDEYGKAIPGDITAEPQYWKSQEYNWRNYMPEAARAIEKLKLVNPENKPELATNPHLTTIVVETPDNLAVGDRFLATIYAFNGVGEAKSFGGDYFRARIIYSEDVGSERPNGIACHITDNQDGTYSLQSPLPMSGSMNLEVVLVYSVEDIAELVVGTSKRRYSGHGYTTKLENGEMTECNVDLASSGRHNLSQLCDYSNRRNNEPYFCFKPKSKQCPRISWSAFKKSTDETKELLDITMKAFNFNDQIVLSPNCTFNVSGKYVRKNLKRCTMETPLEDDKLRPHGYIYNGHWVSLKCNNQLNFEAVFKCLKNKVVYILGDSTLRQFFETLSKEGHLTVSGPNSETVWTEPKIATDKTNNITIYYRSHGPPMQNEGPLNHRPYISDVLDEITDQSVTYIVITIGLHMLFYEPSVFIHRILGIRDSIERLLERKPDTKVVLKGNNAFISPQDWLGLRYDNIMNQIFKNMRSVVFVRLWDLSTVWPLRVDYHPVGPTLIEEVLYTFEFLCGDS